MPGIDQIRQRLRPVWEARGELIALWIFGSVAEGRADKQSDVDLAVLLREQLSLYDQALLAEHCMNALGREDVDLVDIRSVTPLLQHRILTRGAILFERDPVARVNFQTQALSIYFDLLPWLERAYAH
ncbi:MAG: nucleotidyltransferase domain-containing protein [Leptospirales bacterium]|nr:nucleotidyltransferase domain-containing protein [Leptospirales bacterium]